MSATKPENGVEFDDFLYRASHDLRAPARRVGAFASLLEEELEGVQISEQAVSFLGFLKVAGQDLEALLDGLLGLSRARSRAVVRSRASLADVAAAAAVLEGLDPAAMSVVGDLPSLDTDPEAVSAIYRALLQNVLVWGGGRCVLSAEQDDGGWVLGVRDQGPGISERDHVRAMSPLVRVGTAATRRAGCGLAVAATHAQRLGGELWLESPEGGGLWVRFRLPG